jgi:hypothetical protein
VAATYDNWLRDPCQPGAYDVACVDVWNGAVKYTQATPVYILGSVGTLLVQADLHTVVGTGPHPGSTKTGINGMDLGVYDKSTGSCAAGIGISWQDYPAVWERCRPVGGATTDPSGMAAVTLPTGNYLLIGYYAASGVYAGVSVGDVTVGKTMKKYLQVIEKSDGKTSPAKSRLYTGSELWVIEPEYVEWSGAKELYPIILESVGDWTVTVGVAPPEGFVADTSSITERVNTTLEAVQFTITDVGSKWVPTKLKYKIKHKGKTIDASSEVGVKLSPKLAKAKGLPVWGDVPPPAGGKRQ